jgi:ribosomal protein S18 acetylase RimI-like enzyme
MINIRQITSSDLEFAASLTAIEGWATEQLEDFAGFLRYDPGGCLFAEEDSVPIGICVGTPYKTSGFLGELIVVEAARGRGVGSKLMQHTIDYLHGRGIENILLDGVPAAVPLYERFGFRKVCRSLRFSGQVEGQAHTSCVRPMRSDDLAALCALDCAAFGEDRSFFLERRFALYPDLSKVLVVDGEIVGFVMGRRRQDIIGVGPWFVDPAFDNPGVLLQSVAAQAQTLELSLGVLKTNTRAVKTIKSLGLVERPDPPWRMVSGNSAQLGAADALYAVGSAAKG